MKRLVLLLVLLSLAICMLSACSKAQSLSPENEEILNKDHVLIVYLSRTRNTEAIAEMIHKEVGGTLVALELERLYPEDYDAIVAQVDRENETGFLPPLKTKIENLQEYDTVFLGFPTWDMQLPPPMKSFLNEYNLSGKTVIPFNTNGGYGVGSSFQTVEVLSSGANILEGFSMKGGLERDGIYFVMEDEREIQAQRAVKQWLQKIQIIK